MSSRKKPDLLGAMRRAKSERSASECTSVAQELDEAERKLESDGRLWSREFVAMAVRGVRRVLAAEGGSPDDTARCDALSDRLRRLDDEEFEPLRRALASGRMTPEDFRRELNRRPPYEWDAYAERLLDIHEVPAPVLERENNMVHYLASPVTSVLDIADRLGSADVLYDMGSGLAKVPLLVAWLTGARTVGVEYEPEYAKVAGSRAERFGFDRVEVICADARELAYDDATAIYFYDPFRGEILDVVLSRIREVSSKRTLTIFSRGFSTETFSGLPWLHHEITTDSELAVFHTSG